MIRLHANTNMLPSNFKQLYSATIVVCVVVLGTIVMYCCVDVYTYFKNHSNYVE